MSDLTDDAWLETIDRNSPVLKALTDNIRGLQATNANLTRDNLKLKAELEQSSGENELLRELAKQKSIKAQELQAENERLSDELSACTSSPGGCGYWKEAHKKLKGRITVALKRNNR